MALLYGWLGGLRHGHHGQRARRWDQRRYRSGSRGHHHLSGRYRDRAHPCGGRPLKSKTPMPLRSQAASAASRILFAALFLTAAYAQYIPPSGGGSSSVTNVFNTTTKHPPDGLTSGGAVAWTSGLSFRVSAAVYVIGAVRYTSAESTVTLSAADATNPRIDVIAVNTSGAVVVIAGTAASPPAKP